MNRSERRELRRTLERRVVAGERKADIVGRAVADGRDWQAMAREIALIPTPARRRRWRWLNRALMLLLVVTAAAEVAGAFSTETSTLWRALDLAYPLFLLLSLGWVARYRQRGYGLAATAGVVGLSWWLYTVGWRGVVDASGALIAAEAVLCALVVVLALIVQRVLLPATRTWTDLAPKTDAAGAPIFEE